MRLYYVIPTFWNVLDLYDLAVRTTKSLEAVHPGGKIIEGQELRPKVTHLVSSARDLYEEACSVLRDRGQCLVSILFDLYSDCLSK